jgi:hypothetical protein
MEKLDKELNVLFEESDKPPKLNYIKENLKHHKMFKKLIKLCVQFKIKLYEIMEDRYIVRNIEKIIKNCYQKRTEMIDQMAKSIIDNNQLEKVVLSRKVKLLMKQDSEKKTDSSSPDETFDIKASIDKLYIDFKNDSKILESLIDLIINHFTSEAIQAFYVSKIQVTKYVEEYVS